MTIINAQLVEKYIKKLKPSKSQGPDNCHPIFLQEIIDEVTEPLSILFNKTLKEDKIPEQWRLANVVPLHKKGTKSNTENYRPISLTSVVSKLMEKIVRDKIMVHMEKKLFTKHQHGLRAGYSCVTELIDVCYIWKKKLFTKHQHRLRAGYSCVTELIDVCYNLTEVIDNKNSIYVIYLDFQKPFDSVPHKRLITKLEVYGIKGELLK